MGRKKAFRIKEAFKLQNVLTKECAKKNKGVWNRLVFNDSNPIVLELGCGKGEYSLELATLYPQRNYIGIDRKADRIWVGATKAINQKLSNIVFVNSNIELVEQIFAKNEIFQIWLTFPDPYPKNPARRLVSSAFLHQYKNILTQKGDVFLKTDDASLFEYALSEIKKNDLNLLFSTNDLYASRLSKDKQAIIKTGFEQKHLSDGNKICFIHFKMS